MRSSSRLHRTLVTCEEWPRPTTALLLFFSEGYRSTLTLPQSSPVASSRQSVPGQTLCDRSTELMSVPSAHSGQMPCTGQPRGTVQFCQSSFLNIVAPPVTCLPDSTSKKSSSQLLQVEWMNPPSFEKSKCRTALECFFTGLTLSLGWPFFHEYRYILESWETATRSCPRLLNFTCDIYIEESFSRNCGVRSFDRPRIVPSTHPTTTVPSFWLTPMHLPFAAFCRSPDQARGSISLGSSSLYSREVASLLKLRLVTATCLRSSMLNCRRVPSSEQVQNDLPSGETASPHTQLVQFWLGLKWPCTTTLNPFTEELPMPSGMLSSNTSLPRVPTSIFLGFRLSTARGRGNLDFPLRLSPRTREACTSRSFFKKQILPPFVPTTRVSCRKDRQSIGLRSSGDYRNTCLPDGEAPFHKSSAPLPAPVTSRSSTIVPQTSWLQLEPNCPAAAASLVPTVQLFKCLMPTVVKLLLLVQMACRMTCRSPFSDMTSPLPKFRTATLCSSSMAAQAIRASLGEKATAQMPLSTGAFHLAMTSLVSGCQTQSIGFGPSQPVATFVLSLLNASERISSECRSKNDCVLVLRSWTMPRAAAWQTTLSQERYLRLLRQSLLRQPWQYYSLMPTSGAANVLFLQESSGGLMAPSQGLMARNQSPVSVSQSKASVSFSTSLLQRSLGTYISKSSSRAERSSQVNFVPMTSQTRAVRSLPPTVNRQWSSQEKTTRVMWEECAGYSLQTWPGTTQGYLNSRTTWSLFPVAISLRERLLHTECRSLKLTVRKIPITGKPNLQVVVAQSVLRTELAATSLQLARLMNRSSQACDTTCMREPSRAQSMFRMADENGTSVSLLLPSFLPSTSMTSILPRVPFTWYLWQPQLTWEPSGENFIISIGDFSLYPFWNSTSDCGFSRYTVPCSSPATIVSCGPQSTARTCPPKYLLPDFMFRSSTLHTRTVLSSPAVAKRQPEGEALQPQSQPFSWACKIN